jgi:hypothetical protein
MFSLGFKTNKKAIRNRNFFPLVGKLKSEVSTFSAIHKDLKHVSPKSRENTLKELYLMYCIVMQF